MGSPCLVRVVMVDRSAPRAVCSVVDSNPYSSNQATAPTDNALSCPSLPLFDSSGCAPSGTRPGLLPNDERSQGGATGHDVGRLGGHALLVVASPAGNTTLGHYRCGLNQPPPPAGYDGQDETKDRLSDI